MSEEQEVPQEIPPEETDETVESPILVTVKCETTKRTIQPNSTK